MKPRSQYRLFSLVMAVSLLLAACSASSPSDPSTASGDSSHDVTPNGTKVISAVKTLQSQTQAPTLTVTKLSADQLSALQLTPNQFTFSIQTTSTEAAATGGGSGAQCPTTTPPPTTAAGEPTLAIPALTVTLLPVGASSVRSGGGGGFSAAVPVPLTPNANNHFLAELSAPIPANATVSLSTPGSFSQSASIVGGVTSNLSYHATVDSCGNSPTLGYY